MRRKVGTTLAAACLVSAAIAAAPPALADDVDGAVGNWGGQLNSAEAYGGFRALTVAFTSARPLRGSFSTSGGCSGQIYEYAQINGVIRTRFDASLLDDCEDHNWDLRFIGPDTISGQMAGFGTGTISLARAGDFAWPEIDTSSLHL